MTRFIEPDDHSLEDDTPGTYTEQAEYLSMTTEPGENRQRAMEDLMQAIIAEVPADLLAAAIIAHGGYESFLAMLAQIDNALNVE